MGITVGLPVVRRGESAGTTAVSRQREALKSLTADSAIYGLGQALGRAVQLALVPVLTRLLTPGEFGVSELVLGYAQVTVLVLVFGMDGALARFFYEEPDRPARVRMVSSSLAFRLVSSGFVAAVFIALAAPLAGWLLHGEAYRKYLVIGATTLPFTMLVLFANDVLRVTFQPVKYITVNVVQTVLVTGASIVLVKVYAMSTAGVLYGRLLGDAVTAVIGLVLTRHTLGFRFDRGTLMRMLRYGAPTVPAAMGFAAITGLDRFALQRTRGIDEVATYAVALRFFSVMTFAASAFQLAYGPFAYARAGHPDSPRLFARVLAAYAALAALGAMVVGLFAPEILRLLVASAYKPERAAFPALLLAFAAVALGAYTVTSIGIGLALRTPLLGLVAWSGALVAAVAHATLTPRYGPPGAAIATLAAYCTVAFTAYRTAQRVHPLPYRGGLAAGLFVSALGLALVASLVRVGGLGSVAVRVAAIVLFAAGCARARVWTEATAVAEHARDRIVHRT